MTSTTSADSGIREKIMRPAVVCNTEVTIVSTESSMWAAPPSTTTMVPSSI